MSGTNIVPFDYPTAHYITGDMIICISSYKTEGCDLVDCRVNNINSHNMNLPLYLVQYITFAVANERVTVSQFVLNLQKTFK